ncbi:MAG: DUF4153 domain-containing protein [Candidatus Limnocylindria bacterium]
MTTGEATLGRAATGTGAARRPAIHRAGRLLATAVVLGLAGQLLFFDVGVGINFPIAIGLLLLSGWLLRRRRTRPALLDAWLAPAAIGFAAFVAIRGDPTIVVLDGLAALALAGCALASFAGRTVVSRSFGGLVQLAAGALGWATVGAVPAIADALSALPGRPAVAQRAAPAIPILRGLALAIPVVLVFVALFSSADAVFARLVEDLFGFDLDVGNVGWRVVLAAMLAWLAAGGLALAASAPTVAEASRTSSGWRIGTTEVIVVLLAVDALFSVFVALQGAYLFGGLDTLQAAGMTYAEYARRGFFELVAVATLAGGLAIAAERLARERSRAVVAAAVGLALLTGVVLISATLRLRLYQEAYGWTEPRLYVLASIVVLGITLIALTGCLVANRVRWIGHVVIVTGLAVGLALNVIGPVRFITEQNVARVVEPDLVPEFGSTGFDHVYAVTLGDDAIPHLLRALPHLDDAQAETLRLELGFRLDELQRSTALNSWQAWNAGRSTARAALEAADRRGELDSS